MNYKNRNYSQEYGRLVSRNLIVMRYAYVDGRPTMTLDPSGEIGIKALKVDKGDCGKYKVEWKFKLGTPAPCDGFFVQKITAVRIHGDCEKKDECPISIEAQQKAKPETVFWESWPVEKGHSHAKLSKKDIDEWISRKGGKGTCGYHYVTGEVKFFCGKTTGNLGDLGEEGLWKPGSEGGHPDSGDLPSTRGEPGWWNDPSVDPTSKHYLEADWSCCYSCFNVVPYRTRGRGDWYFFYLDPPGKQY